MRVSLALGVVSVLMAAPVAAQDAVFDVVNATGFGIVGFYGSADGDVSWEENLLGGQTLAPGASLSVNFDNGSGNCVFDLRAVFDDGDETVVQDVDVCTQKSVTLN
ncbi:hypothetical protein [Paragemmobacter straminiformis]|uniref:Argininosuccinate lyase n=1 Tax=Paragemmobacter straminiformis TaxID=2045119 RepID=A0A842I4C2_9RHOB|nr:hypothetical protein [Gemmobacter straminiformis]MBC2834273.1 hypothetical protein [Gemmobacter straminiformis]